MKEEILKWLRFLRDVDSPDFFQRNPETTADSVENVALDVFGELLSSSAELRGDWARALVRIRAAEKRKALGEPTDVDKQEEEPREIDAPEVPIPKLAAHQIDVPEEPEHVRVVSMEWDPAKGDYVPVDYGVLLLVPTGCERPSRVSPFRTKMCYRSPLPRDKAGDMNLYTAYQKLGLVDRAWMRANIDEEIDALAVDRGIADDVPVLMALSGKAEGGPNGVAQSDTSKGSNNGAPLPPGPGPGRGNKFAPGDNMG